MGIAIDEARLGAVYKEKGWVYISLSFRERSVSGKVHFTMMQIKDAEDIRKAAEYLEDFAKRLFNEFFKEKIEALKETSCLDDNS